MLEKKYFKQKIWKNFSNDVTIPEKQPKISALVSLVKVKSQDFMENFDPNKNMELLTVFDLTYLIINMYASFCIREIAVFIQNLSYRHTSVPGKK